MKRNRVLFLLVFLFSLFAITRYGGSAAYLLFYSCLSVLIICPCYLLYVYFQFRIYQSLESRWIVKGEQTGYHFALSNENYVTFSSVKVHFYETHSEVMDYEGTIECELLPRRKLEFDSQMICRYRGEYPVGVKKVTITDFFRLFSVTYHVPFQLKAVVFPRIVVLEQLDGMAQDIEELLDPYAVYKDEPDVTVRDYLQGDPLKWVNWKLSAGKQNLQVREMSGKTRNRLMLFIDLKPIDLPENEKIMTEDTMMECMVSLLHYFCAANLIFTVGWSNQSVVRKEITDSAMFGGVYEELARVGFAAGASLPELLTGSGRWNEQKHIIWITQTLSDDSFQMAADCGHRSGRITILTITEENMEKYQKMTSDTVKLLVIRPEDDIRDVL